MSFAMDVASGRPLAATAAARDCSSSGDHLACTEKCWKQSLREDAESGLAAAAIRQHVISRGRSPVPTLGKACNEVVQHSPVKKGDEVQLSHLRRRPWLNGVCAEVVSNGVDEQGFVVLRMPTASRPSSATNDQATPEFKRVRPTNLQQVRPASSPGSLLRSWSTQEFRKSAVAERLEAPKIDRRTKSRQSSGFAQHVAQLQQKSQTLDFPGTKRAAQKEETILTCCCPVSGPDSLHRRRGRSSSAPRSTLSTFHTGSRKKEVRIDNPDVSLTSLLSMGCQNNPIGN